MMAAATVTLGEPRDSLTRRRRGREVRYSLAQERLVALCELFAACAFGVDMRKLGAKHRRIQVCKVGLVSELDHIPMLVVRSVALHCRLGDSMRSQAAQPLSAPTVRP